MDSVEARIGLRRRPVEKLASGEEEVGEEEEPVVTLPTLPFSSVCVREMMGLGCLSSPIRVLSGTLMDLFIGRRGIEVVGSVGSPSMMLLVEGEGGQTKGIPGLLLVIKGGSRSRRRLYRHEPRNKDMSEQLECVGSRERSEKKSGYRQGSKEE